MPYTSVPTGSCSSGTIEYCSADGKLYGCRSGTWQPLGAGSATDRAEVTRIVAASNSLGSNNGGADCDGVGGACTNPRADYTCDGTNDHFVINRAINDLPSSGGTVFLLEGTYNITSYYVTGDQLQEGPGIHLDRNNVALMGSGRATKLKICNPAGTLYTSGVEVINIPYAHTFAIEGILIKGLTIDGNSNIGSGNIGIALYGPYAVIKNIKIDKVFVKDINGDGIRILSNAENISITNSFIQYNAAYGINLVCDAAEQSNNRINISGNTISNNGHMGVRISGLHNNYVLVQKNNILLNGCSGIGVCRASYSIIRANNIIDNGIPANCASFSSGIFMDNMNIPGYGKVGFTTDSTLICENNISGNNECGINLANNDHQVYIYRNVFFQNRMQSIYLYNSTYNFISANVSMWPGVSGSGRRGIEIGSGCQRTYISGNRIASPNMDNYYGLYINPFGTTDVVNNYIYANKFDSDDPGRNNHPYYNANDNYGYLDYQNHGTLFTDKRALNMHQESIGVDGDMELNADDLSVSYIRLGGDAGGGNLTLTNGRTKGDILIVEGRNEGSPYMISNGGNISMSVAQFDLGYEDTAVFIWDGEKWVMIGGAHNSYDF